MNMETNITIRDVQNLLKAGNVQGACALAEKRNTMEIRNAGVHLQWADLLEELELFDEAIVELNLALRDAPGNPVTCRRLADTYIDQGDVVRAAKCLWGLVKNQPDNSGHYKSIGQILEQGGEYEKARKVYEAGYENTKDESLKKLLKSLDMINTQQPHDQEAIEKGDQIVPSQHNLVTFMSLFSGREGVYARQWASPTGKTGYTPVHEPFTLKVAEHHILGNLTAGVYPIRMDNTVNFIAFDLDLPKFVINKAISQESQWKRAMDRLHREACRLIDLASAHDIPIYLEDSGFKGRHGWIFLETPVPADTAKKFGEILLSQMPGGHASEVQIEIFPKQGRVIKGSLGNLIKLPLGFHRRTGKRSLFIRPHDSKPVDNQLNFMEQVNKTSKQAVYKVIQHFQIVVPAIPSPETVTPQQPAVILPPARVYDIERDPKAQYLLLKCPVLRRIVEKINHESSITNEESIVLTHTLGYLDNGPDAVNQLFQRCVNANPSNFLKSRLKGNPISCPKIRNRIPEITSKVACNCQFNLSTNLYPSPVVHTYSVSDHDLNSAVGLTIDSLQFQNLVHEYMSLLKQSRQIEILLKKHEDRLREFFSHAGVDTVQTPLGRLKQVMDNENRFTYLLELSD
ncbi:MAG TPA: CRISPR-associated primase-polymerase type A1 [Thermodesulfovibrionia bacterium]|nr:CRISPR-associated primase-polymerase type A1 [Thermodesulfovibrionia bacterium]